MRCYPGHSPRRRWWPVAITCWRRVGAFRHEGAYPTGELGCPGPGDNTVRAVHVLAVPGLDEQRHLVELIMRKGEKLVEAEPGQSQWQGLSR